MSKINVMIVEDEEIDRYTTTRTLGKFDVFGTVAELPDGTDALDLFRSPDFADTWAPPPPALILLDINMPEMSGFEFLDQIEQLRNENHAGWTGCVILMLTSSLHPQDREKATQHDLVHGYIQKPITAEKVQAILDEHY